MNTVLHVSYLCDSYPVCYVQVPCQHICFTCWSVCMLPGAWAHTCWHVCTPVCEWIWVWPTVLISKAEGIEVLWQMLPCCFLADSPVSLTHKIALHSSYHWAFPVAGCLPVWSWNSWQYPGDSHMSLPVSPRLTPGPGRLPSVSRREFTKFSWLNIWNVFPVRLLIGTSHTTASVPISAFHQTPAKDRLCHQLQPRVCQTCPGAWPREDRYVILVIVILCFGAADEEFLHPRGPFLPL
jgi:hypothetical protein